MKIFSGIQPTGIIHIGNYLGAIKQWAELQEKAEKSIFCVVDLHAITVPQDSKELRENILNAAAMYIACGIKPEKSAIFVQSMRPEHSELMWILNCNARMGELYRMTQYKDKIDKSEELASVGLFDYPILMAADILLYGTTHVPVGEDQKQHVELTRDLAIRFNKKYGETFIVPEPIIKKETARIMSISDPTKKMSKSSASVNDYIAMTDDPQTIREKIKRAVTDSGTEVKSDKDKPAMTNLLNIYSEISGKTVSELENDFTGKTYSQFKESLADELIDYLAPIQEKYFRLIKDRDELEKILNEGNEKVRETAQKTLREVKGKIGLM